MTFHSPDRNAGIEDLISLAFQRRMNTSGDQHRAMQEQYRANEARARLEGAGHRRTLELGNYGNYVDPAQQAQVQSKAQDLVLQEQEQKLRTMQMQDALIKQLAQQQNPGQSTVDLDPNSVAALEMQAKKQLQQKSLSELLSAGTQGKTADYATMSQAADPRIGLSERGQIAGIQKANIETQKARADLDAKLPGSYTAPSNQQRSSVPLPSELQAEFPEATNPVVQQSLKNAGIDKLQGTSFLPDWHVYNTKAYHANSAAPAREQAVKDYQDSQNILFSLKTVQEAIDSAEGVWDFSPKSEKGAIMKQAVVNTWLYLKNAGGFQLGVLAGPDMDLLEGFALDPTNLENNLMRSKEQVQKIYRRAEATMYVIRDQKLAARGIGKIYKYELPPSEKYPEGATAYIPSWKSAEYFRKWAKEGAL